MEMNHLAPVFLTGNHRLVSSIAVCLLRAGHPVTICSTDTKRIEERIHLHYKDMKQEGYEIDPYYALQIISELRDDIKAELAIIVTYEDVDAKRNLIQQVEQRSSSDTIIALNTESISLRTLQEGYNNPGRIVGINWTEPAHTTFFMELIANHTVKEKYIDQIFCLAKDHWQKDPYIVRGEMGIRSRLVAALAREAFYLVQNGYATVEDIDRACRNDAGYYMPFCGYCRYMDLMGTYAYGMVMKELNPDLSRNTKPPAFFNDIIASDGKGMENREGLYQYSPEDVKKWDFLFRKFSYQIKKTMELYPFNYKKNNTLLGDISISD